MGVRGGDIRQLIIAGRELDPANDADVSIMRQGFDNENLPTGNGKLHVNQKRKLAGFDGMEVSSDDVGQDLEYLQDISNAGDPVPVTLTLASGVTYSGSLSVEGEITKASSTGKIGFAMRGQSFEQI